MILQCSECKARYLVPDQAIGLEGRTVRCANCKHMWFQELPGEAAKVLDELDKVLDEINARPKPIAPGSNLPVIRREIIPLGLRASACAAGVAALALMLLIIRPGLLGLPSTAGLALADVGITRLSEDNHVIYTINGKISNSTERPADVPGLRITLIDKDGNALQSRDVGSAVKSIEAGKAVTFTVDKLIITNPKATRFVVEIGSPLELALRRKPE